MIFAGYAKVAPGKPQTGWVKLKISPGTGEAKFSLVEGIQVSLGLLQRGVSWLLSYFYDQQFMISDGDMSSIISEKPFLSYFLQICP